MILIFLIFYFFCCHFFHVFLLLYQRVFLETFPAPESSSQTRNIWVWGYLPEIFTGKMNIYTVRWRYQIYRESLVLFFTERYIACVLLHRRHFLKKQEVCSTPRGCRACVCPLCTLHCMYQCLYLW